VDPIASHGHWKGDAARMKELVEEAQRRLLSPPAGRPRRTE